MNTCTYSTCSICRKAVNEESCTVSLVHSLGPFYFVALSCHEKRTNVPFIFRTKKTFIMILDLGLLGPDPDLDRILT
jgi:hypothetical protein